MSLFSILIEQAKQGSVKSYQLLPTIHQGVRHEACGKAAKMEKVGPGHFEVSLYPTEDAEKPQIVYKAGTPVEAKLTVLDWLTK